MNGKNQKPLTPLIRVKLDSGRTGEFLNSLLRNLHNPDEKTRLEWIRDSRGHYHTRLNYAQAPVTVRTSFDRNSGLYRFKALEIRGATPDEFTGYSDHLWSLVKRDELEDAGALTAADRLVRELAEKVSPDRHHLADLLDKFIRTNRE
ncbi:hypothetical protein [Breznakiella homolactica]|uniref:Uncharacterized protein n=1 Tax=Breznakiella homolactica TaxID=2798577 RepID=A0A7T7XJW4_9SPIR|nr:hypothetical protein [Breznakiella homolactica]QQO07598.1 hypothetical protein JFL75_11640 [Breznakiella homolactica]